MWKNFTPFVLARPNNYIRDTAMFKNMNIERWSDDFNYDEDGWGGVKDFAQDPAYTFYTKHGDCEDYALVVCSWLKSNDRDATILVLWEPWSIVSDHIAVYDGERIYSSGVILDMTIDEYMKHGGYSRVMERSV